MGCITSLLIAIQDFLVSGVRWGGENRHVYRWNFNPIFVPYPKVSGVRCLRCQVSGLRAKEVTYSNYMDVEDFEVYKKL